MIIEFSIRSLMRNPARSSMRKSTRSTMQKVDPVIDEKSRPGHRREIFNELKLNERLTGQIGHRFKLFFPILGDLDALILLALTIYSHSHRVGMVEELLKVLRFHAVEDVKKIVPGWSLVLWINVGEILHEFTVLLEIRPQCLDGYFIVVRDMDVIDLLLLE